MMGSTGPFLGCDPNWKWHCEQVDLWCLIAMEVMSWTGQHVCCDTWSATNSLLHTRYTIIYCECFCLVFDVGTPIDHNKLDFNDGHFFSNNAMVMFFSQGTIVIDGFSMVLPPLDHHHWMFIYRSTIEIDGFSMVFPKFWCDGQRWFWPWKRPKNARNRDVLFCLAHNLTT